MVSTQFRQRQSWGFRFPERVPGPSEYPCVGQSRYARHEDGQRPPAHPGGGSHIGVLDLLCVHDEERDGEWRLVFTRLGGPVVTHVGAQAGQDSPGVTGTQLLLEVERYLEAPCGHLSHGVWGDGRLAPVESAVGLRGRYGPKQLAARRGSGLSLKLREEPGHAVGVLRLTRPCVDPVAHMPPATLVVGGDGCAPDALCRGELGAVPVGDVADALGGQRVAGLAPASSPLCRASAIMGQI